MDDWRFTSIDPLWETQIGLSPYHYCANNPLKYIDPTGKEGQIVGKNYDDVGCLIAETEFATGTKLTCRFSEQNNMVKGEDGKFHYEKQIVAKIESFVSTDDRFKSQQADLQKIIDNEGLVTIKYDNDGKSGTAGTGGGNFDPTTGVVSISPSFKNGNSGGYFYKWEDPSVSFMQSFFTKQQRVWPVLRHGFDTIAHELLGHALDWIQNKPRDEGWARSKEAAVQMLRGKLPRNTE